MRESDVVGALITSHKAAVFASVRTEFDLLEPMTGELAEIGVIFKRGGLLCGGVSDVQSGGAILSRILVDERWRRGLKRSVVLGAGGAGLAVIWNLAVKGVGGAEHVTVVEADQHRSALARRLVAGWGLRCPVEVVDSIEADNVTRNAGRGALIINATGLGKDRPGSPVSADCHLPQSSLIWDFNYRGSLEFLETARVQANASNLAVNDGFDYFACGWSVVMSRVAEQQWTEDLFEAFLAIASNAM